MFKEPTGTLLVIVAIAFTAPLMVKLAPWLRLPALVIEILLGILVGPAGLNLVVVTDPIELLAGIGLAALIFLAGFEINPQRLRGKPLKLAVAGWFLSIFLGLASSTALHVTGMVTNELYIGLALTTTALGVLLPILRDAGLLPTVAGTHTLSIGSVGEFGPIVAVALILSGTGFVTSLFTLFVFSGIAVVAMILAARPKPPRFQQALGSTLRSSGQLYIRLAMLLIAVLAFAATQLGLDTLLGAFTAGIVYRLLVRTGASPEEEEQVESKIEALFLGCFVPIFFVVTGIKFDLASLTSRPSALAELPLFLALFLLVRGVPLVLYRSELPVRSDRMALAFLSATALPLVVAITEIGLATGQMQRSTAAAMVGAGMLSVVFFPAIGVALLKRNKVPAFALLDNPLTSPADPLP